MQEFDELTKFARSLDFDVYGFGVQLGYQVVLKKTLEGDYIWWPIEKEGSGFTRLFKGFSRYARES